MNLKDMTVSQFSEVLAGNEPAPGGGSTAALEGALGASLVGMVAGLTVGRKKYLEYEAEMKETAAKADAVRRDFLDVMDRDTEAYNQVSAVFTMPKDTDEEKAARRAAMQAGLKACTLTPHDMMRYALAGLRLAEGMLGKFNQNAASDLGVGALSLQAAAQGAWMNIKINIGGIEDTAFAEKYRKEGQEILAEAQALAQAVLAAVDTAL